MRGIYLGAYRALHNDYDIIYQDINGKRDIGGDMMNVDLSIYDFIIATPPCNYWSRGNYRRDSSEYSLLTRHLLPDILKKLVLLNKPFIVENVRNSKLFEKYGFYSSDNYFTYTICRHTYFTNIYLNAYDLLYLKTHIISDIYSHQLYDKRHGRVQCIPSSERQGGEEVHFVIDYLLSKLKGE